MGSGGQSPAPVQQTTTEEATAIEEPIDSRPKGPNRDREGSVLDRTPVDSADTTVSSSLLDDEKDGENPATNGLLG